MTIADGKLGHRELAKLSQPGEIIWDGELKGFGARKSENFISFVLMFRNKEGRQRFYTIGKYGSPWTPNIAREKAKELLYQVSQGRDPQTEKINARSADTVEDLCNQYLEEAETGRLRIRGGREKKASTIESDKSRIRCAKGRGRGIAGGRGLAAECGLKGGEMKPSDDLIGNLLEGLVPQTAALTDRMVQPTVQLDHISGSEFAAMLCVSHEYARRLIVASGRGTNNQSNYWVIGRTWAERFALLRRCCRDHNRKLANVDWFESAQRVRDRRSIGRAQ